MVTKKNNFIALTPRINIVKKNFVRNVQIFVISWSFCPWQAFPNQREAPFSLTSAFPQTLVCAGNATQGQTLQLNTKICELWTKIL
jgi:hypothetical protein